MTVEEIRTKIEASVAGVRIAVVANGSPSAQHSLLVDTRHAFEVALLLRDHPEFRFDYCSNMTAIDWPEIEVAEKVKITKLIDGVEQHSEETRKVKMPGYLEAVYHLFSMEKNHGPVVLRLRTEDRSVTVRLPSLTPVWRSAEYQEREAFDLFGIVFDGHPDLRRIFMWDEFTDYPMRRDYVPPADEEPEWATGAAR